jgi:rRNA maturation RNase YbeY
MPPVRSAPKPLALAVTARAGARYVPYVRRHLRRAHAILNPPLRELSLAFVGDAHMSRLHEQFMAIAGPTDVLTFPLDEDARGGVTAGEVVVCVPEARRRAKAHGVGVERELLLYALHGLLHLSGYDDRTAPDFRRMHRTEDMILTQLGVGPVFAPPRGAGVSPASSANGKTRTRRARRANRMPARGGSEGARR